MAGWSIVADGCTLDHSKTFQKLQESDFGFEILPVLEGCGEEGDEDHFRCFFINFLSHFLKKIYARVCFRPLPPMLGNGKRVDLLKLLFSVREKGGYDTVSENGLWDAVAEELGLGCFASSAVKLVFAKYLYILERLLEKILKDKNSEGGLIDGGVNSSGLLMDTKDFENLLSAISDQNKKDEEYPDLGSTKSSLKLPTVLELFGNDCAASFVESVNGKRCVDDYENEISCLALPAGTKRCIDKDIKVACCSFSLNQSKMCSDNENDVESSLELDGGCNFVNGEDKYGGNECVFNGSEVRSSTGRDGVNMCVDDDKDGVKICVDDDKDVIVIDSAVNAKEKFPIKRKRGSFVEMLNWVTRVAKDPCDPVIETLPGMSKWKFSGDEEYWKQALLTREVLFFKRIPDTIAEQSTSQKKQKMHPSLYDDHIMSSHQLTDRLRCSQRLLFAKKSQARSCSDSSSSGAQSDSDNNSMDDGLKRESLGTANGDSLLGLSGNNHSRKRIPVGPYFQAKVPEWTGVASESDSKWLGSQVWPAENLNLKLIERDRIGKGRQDSCGCRVRNSVQCVRFHVALKRVRLDLELDSAFSSWKFDEMGENVALSWTEEDKKKFEATVRSNPPSLVKSFWDEIYKTFPFKSKEDLVSYYFNVFLLQRRAYQNRFTPTNINSDDDDEETKMGSPTKHEVVRSPVSLLHAKSKRCVDSRTQ